MRINALVLVRASEGRVLMVKGERSITWSLPGNFLRQGETIPDAAARALKQQTRLIRSITRFLVLNHLPAHSGTGHEELTVICDGGELGEGESVAVPAPFAVPGIADIEWVGENELPLYAAEDPYRWAIEEAVAMAEKKINMLLPRKDGEMAHSDIDPLKPPRRRIGALVIVRDSQGRVLLVRPTYGTGGLQLPGGGVHAGEYVSCGAARELREETGLVRKLRTVVALDHMPENSTAAEGYNVVLDGGVLPDDEARAVAVPEDARDELSECVWVHPSALDEVCEPYQARRIREGLAAIAQGAGVPLLIQGEHAAA